ncbi:MAG: hypothetical protein B6A08_19260 [Sorangiineae bacterium NIC37A_2]|nr:MAG: hypothetical protein B6A08_19260 [Sorangiineae bacterium NIC37A_2]
MATKRANTCKTCFGTGEVGSESGAASCPDCGGSGELPDTSVLVEWRARDIEAHHMKRQAPESADVLWLVSELRRARTALAEILSLASEVEDSDLSVALRAIANRALQVYRTTPVDES